MIVQRPIIAYLALGAHKKAGNIDADARLGPILGAALLDGLKDIWEGLIAGARSMMSVGVATAAAGIIVGVVTSTGLVGRFVQLIDTISFGNVNIMLVLTAVTSMILGMGLPTHGQLHSHGDPDRTGDRRVGRECRADLPVDRRPSFRLLLRHPGRRHGRRLAWPPTPGRLSPSQIRSVPASRVSPTTCARRSCRSSSSTTPNC